MNFKQRFLKPVIPTRGKVGTFGITLCLIHHEKNSTGSGTQYLQLSWLGIKRPSFSGTLY